MCEDAPGLGVEMFENGWTRWSVVASHDFFLSNVGYFPWWGSGAVKSTFLGVAEGWGRLRLQRVNIMSSRMESFRYVLVQGQMA